MMAVVGDKDGRGRIGMSAAVAEGIKDFKVPESVFTLSSGVPIPSVVGNPDCSTSIPYQHLREQHTPESKEL